MGYLSDACLCLKKDAIGNFISSLGNYSPTELRTIDNFFARSKSFTHQESGDKLWHWHDVKWDSDIAEVAFVESFMDALPNTDYLFIRVGDDMEDNEVKGWYFQNPFEMSLHRTIEFAKLQ